MFCFTMKITCSLLAIIGLLCSNSTLITAGPVAASREDTLSRGVVDRRSVNLNKRADGYVVYNRDTLRGFIFVSKDEVNLEHPISNELSKYYNFQLRDRSLSFITMYNHDKKPLCLTRVRPNDRNMMRLVHEGKINIYDDRINYIYDPEDIDKNMIMISYDGIVEDLSSFLTETTKRDLIDFINDVYSLKLDPKTLTWKELLIKIDKLD